MHPGLPGLSTVLSMGIRRETRVVKATIHKAGNEENSGDSYTSKLARQVKRDGMGNPRPFGRRYNYKISRAGKNLVQGSMPRESNYQN